MDTAQQLRELAEAEKRQKTIELEQLRAQAITENDRQKATITPQFQAQRSQVSAQSQIGAKNFAEFMANRGQTQQGISQQAELSRGNVLGRNLGDIQTQENTAFQNVANQQADIQSAYNRNLTSAYGSIDQSLRNSLFELAQQQEAERKAGAGSGSGDYTFDEGVDGKKVTLKNGEWNGMPKSNAKYGMFSNGYQPRGIAGHGALSKTGHTITNGQNIWKAENGTQWYWEPKTRTYKRFVAKTNTQQKPFKAPSIRNSSLASLGMSATVKEQNSTPYNGYTQAKPTTMNPFIKSPTNLR